MQSSTTLASEQLLGAFHQMLSVRDEAELLGVVLEQAGHVVDFEAATAFLLSDGILRPCAFRGPAMESASADVCGPFVRGSPLERIVEERQPLIIQDAAGESPLAQSFREAGATSSCGFSSDIRSWLGIPIASRERILGLLALGHRQPAHFAESHARALLLLADGAAIALEHVRLASQANALATELERQRVARELHDSVAQSLYSVTLYAESIRRMLQAGQADQALDAATTLKETALDALREMRLIIHALRPPRLAELGLAGALRARLSSVEARSGMRTTLEAEPALELELALQQELFRLASEALNNVTKHARASEVRVTLCRADDMIQLQVADDGVGFDPAATPRGIGLEIMRERAAALGATWNIDSAPGRGTRACFCVPLEAGAKP